MYNTDNTTGNCMKYKTYMSFYEQMMKMSSSSDNQQLAEIPRIINDTMKSLVKDRVQQGTMTAQECVPYTEIFPSCEIPQRALPQLCRPPKRERSHSVINWDADDTSTSRRRLILR